MTRIKILALATGAIAASASIAFAVERDVPGSAIPVTQAEPSPEACTRTIKAMGASMGYTVMVAEKPTFLFVLRVNGVDYNAVCDAASGTVKDVTPRQAQ